MKRREFLGQSASALFLPVVVDGFGAKVINASSPLMQALIAAADVNDRVLVIIQLSGGNDGLNMVIPLDQMSTYTNLRSNIAIKQAKVLPLNGNNSVGLHPSMTGLQRHFNNGKLSIVQAVSYPNPNFSHFEASDIWMTAVDAGKSSSSGWMARHLLGKYPGYPTGYPNTTMPDPVAIQIGSVTTTTLMASQPMAMLFQNPDQFAQLVGDKPLVPPGGNTNTASGKHLAFIRQVQTSSVAYAGQIKAAANLGKNLATYPTGNGLADQLKVVSRLIHGGLRTKVYFVSTGGFDTHDKQVNISDTSTGAHANLMKGLSDAISVFLDDLKLQGIDQKVVGMTFSEFGRRAASNDSYGTDHGTASPLFVFGAGIKTTVVGKSPNLSDLTNGNLKMVNDFREVYSALLTDWFGATNASTTLFRAFTPSPIFRSTVLAREATPETVAITEIKAYPNPARDYLTLESAAFDAPIQRLSVYNTLGQEMNVSYQQLSSYQVEVDVNHLSEGQYIVKVGTASTQLQTRVLIAR
jgi:uncharacterized protein (DUF1501 family)